MKTSALVNLLARDPVVLPPPGRLLVRALVPAGLVSIAMFAMWAGVRPDLGWSGISLRFEFKLLLNFALWIFSIVMVLQLSRPGARSTRGWWLLAAVPVLLTAGVVTELAVLPQQDWWNAARGHNATWCLRIIPALALAPLAAALWMLRRAAPERPAVAGAVAGLMAAGLAGSLYALHCTDDSPLFVALWYGLAASLVTALGAVLGARLLRW
jgi:hypothetical protein